MLSRAESRADAARASPPPPEVSAVTAVDTSVTDHDDAVPAGGRRSLGLEVEDAPSRSGVIVIRTRPGAPAARAGLAKGNVIVRLGDDDVECCEDFVAAWNRAAARGTQETIVFMASDGRRTERREAQLDCA